MRWYFLEDCAPHNWENNVESPGLLIRISRIVKQERQYLNDELREQSSSL